MFWYVYILRSLRDNNFYTGVTNNLRRRLLEHQNGQNISTKYRLPLKLIYYEAYLLKIDAEAREKYLKTNMGRRVLRKQISNLMSKMKVEKVIYI